MREAQAYLTKKLRERDLGRYLEGAKVTLNEYLDRWIQTAVKPRVREKTCQDYEGMLRRYIRPHLGERVLAAMRPLDIQTTYQQMIERGLSSRTVRYTHAVLKSAMRQALQWRLLLENPADGVKTPQRIPQPSHSARRIILILRRRSLRQGCGQKRNPDQQAYPTQHVFQHESPFRPRKRHHTHLACSRHCTIVKNCQVCSGKAYVSI